MSLTVQPAVDVKGQQEGAQPGPLTCISHFNIQRQAVIHSDIHIYIV